MGMAEAEAGVSEDSPKAGDAAEKLVELELLLGSSSRTDSFVSDVTALPAAASGPWRPWHKCDQLCWEQRRQPPRSGPLGVRLSKAQADDQKHPQANNDSIKGTSLLTKSLRPSTSLASRPKWNPYLSAANPNWIRDGVNEDVGKPR